MNAAEIGRMLTAQGAEMVAALALPALTGSEKQIEWATSIRAGVLLGLCTEKATCARRIAKYGADAESNAVRAQIDEVLPQVLAITDARFWIDHRGIECAAAHQTTHQTLKAFGLVMAVSS